ncbi:MAG TPA: MFS transporter [Candidatus Limnocylindria bacterium]|nr:MFS transporter [Candidatus Limnocylindria bacterium]
MFKRFGPLVEPNFRRLWIGQTTSAIGDGVTGVALTFAVLSVRGSAADLGFVLASFMVPRVLFMLVGGVWADRLPRRLIMVGSDVVRAAAQLVLAVAILFGAAGLPIFVVVAIVSGAASAFFQPAVIGLIPQTISPARLQQGNALLNLSQSTAQMIGPIASGMLVALIGSGWIFALDAVSFAISAVFLLSLRVPPAPAAERQSFLTELADGWHEVVSRRWLVTSLGAFAFGNLAFAAFFVLGPLVVQERLNGAADWGILMGVFGFGGLAGGALALRWRPVRPLIATFGLLFAGPAALLVLSAAPALPVLAIALAVMAVAISACNTFWHTTLQQHVPEQAISRVSSYDWMVSLLIFPVGAAVAGPLADGLGPERTLFIFAALSAIPTALVLGMRSVREVRRTDASVTDRAVDNDQIEDLPPAAAQKVA